MKDLKVGSKSFDLAVDTTKNPYYGQDDSNIREINEKPGKVWEFASISMVDPYQLPIMGLPYFKKNNLGDVSIELLDFAQSLDLNINRVYFDRGFYNWQLIGYLESEKVPYIIFAPRTPPIKKFIEQLGDKDFGVFDHQAKDSKYDSIGNPKTKIVIFKEKYEDKNGEVKIKHWCFATNIPNPDYKILEYYKKRWGIETGYRLIKESGPKTKSNHPKMRYFYFILSMLFVIIWTVKKYKERKYRETTTPLKKFLLEACFYLREQEILKINKIQKPP